MKPLPTLPISDVLPDILSALGTNPNLVLVAPPGAGKTTIVPLALLDADWRNGKQILVLEPRRLAARSAATRMASLLGEAVGERVGYRVRFDTKISKNTIIEVVTEGVFGRMLSSDPGLENVAAVLFDEFHERSLDGDLALALCLDLQAGLREDLRLVPMSATLDGAGVAKLLGAKIVESEGRGFPIEITHKDRLSNEKIESAMASAIYEELSGGIGGSILAFLPGQREIERTYDLLEGQLLQNIEVHRLYGALSQGAQDGAIRPPKEEVRKVVLASAIAETSLTIEGVNTVIDSGLSRQPVFEPATGLTRLQTVRASQASITQRSGRAGRLGPGKSVRLWRAEQTAALPPSTPPEILNADLSALLLDLADWGVHDIGQLKWLDLPPAAALAEAENLLMKMGAMEGGQITRHGKSMRQIGFPPRFSHMVIRAAEHSKTSAKRAALLALLIQERGAGGRSTDLAERCEKAAYARDKRTQNLIRLAANIAVKVGGNNNTEALPHGVLLGFAFPDRIAQNRGQASDGSIRYRLANGRGAQMDATEVLAREEFLIVVDMAGRAGAARILAAAALTKAELLENFSEGVEERNDASFDLKTGRLTATRATRFGALVLGKPVKVPVDADAALKALLQAVREHGLEILPWRDEDLKLRGQLALLHTHIGEPWPEVNDEALLTTMEQWVSPFLSGHQSLAALGKGALSDGLMLLAGHPSKQEIDALTPSHFHAPSGSRIPIEYSDGKALLRVRPQELFGLDQHPSFLDGRLGLDIELLSPAGRAIQITQDLPGFWRGTWADVRRDMRGRYPKHPWPEDPLSAAPTQRVKLRKVKK